MSRLLGAVICGKKSKTASPAEYCTAAPGHEGGCLFRPESELTLERKVHLGLEKNTKVKAAIAAAIDDAKASKEKWLADEKAGRDAQ